MRSEQGSEGVQILPRSDLGKEVAPAVLDARICELVMSVMPSHDSRRAYIQGSKLHVGVLV